MSRVFSTFPFDKPAMQSVALRRASVLAARPLHLVCFCSSFAPHSSPLSSALFYSEYRSHIRDRKTWYEHLKRTQEGERNLNRIVLAASEVSSILESRIAGTSFGGDVQETGRVLSKSRIIMNLLNLVLIKFTAIGDGIARVYGTLNNFASTFDFG